MPKSTLAAPGTAVGAVSSNSNFLTCVTRAVCYIKGYDHGSRPDIARTVDGGVTWCAVREPTINTDTPEHLSQEIELAEADHAAGIVSES